MIIAIVFAELWGVIQLIVLGSFARTVRVRTVLMAVAVGLYACAPLAVLMETSWIHVAAWLTGTPAYQLVKIASYTADPFVEEVVKVLPVVVLLTIPAIRRQLSITDCVLLGAAGGAGFGLAEELYRFGADSPSALWNATFGGWMLPGVFATPTVPSPWTTVTSWLPPGVLPNELLTLSLNHYPAVNLHLAWSAVGGLAVGLICLRATMISRIAGAILLLYVAGDHAVSNAQVSTGVALLRNVLALMPIVALGIGWWCDRGRRAAPVSDAVRSGAGTTRVPGRRRGWHSVLAGLRTPELRRDRSARPGANSSGAPAAEVARLGPRVAAAGTVAAAALMLPTVLWYGVAGWPQMAWLQAMLTSASVWRIVLVFSTMGQALLVWQLVAALRAWPRIERGGDGEHAATAGLAIASSAGALSLGLFTLFRVFDGSGPMNSLNLSVHVLEAFSQAYVVTALMVAGGGLLVVPASGIEAMAMSGAAGGAAVDMFAAGALGGAAAGALGAGALIAAGASGTRVLDEIARRLDDERRPATEPAPDGYPNHPPATERPGPPVEGRPTEPAPEGYPNHRPATEPAPRPDAVDPHAPTWPAPIGNPAPDIGTKGPMPFPGDPSNPVIPGPPRLPNLTGFGPSGPHVGPLPRPLPGAPEPLGTAPTEPAPPPDSNGHKPSD